LEAIWQNFGPDNPLTRLVPDLRGVDPDDAFSVIPYEKGSTFLWYLEELVGGADKFEPFLRAYFTAFAYKSIDSDTFKNFFLEFFASVEAVKVCLLFILHFCL
jgi:leukotriene-A4 hydrolase